VIDSPHEEKSRETQSRAQDGTKARALRRSSKEGMGGWTEEEIKILGGITVPILKAGIEALSYMETNKVKFNRYQNFEANLVQKIFVRMRVAQLK
jgi:hypothetical protein